VLLRAACRSRAPTHAAAACQAPASAQASITRGGAQSRWWCARAAHLGLGAVEGQRKVYWLVAGQAAWLRAKGDVAEGVEREAEQQVLRHRRVVRGGRGGLLLELVACVRVSLPVCGPEAGASRWLLLPAGAQVPRVPPLTCTSTTAPASAARSSRANSCAMCALNAPPQCSLNARTLNMLAASLRWARQGWPSTLKMPPPSSSGGERGGSKGAARGRQGELVSRCGRAARQSEPQPRPCAGQPACQRAGVPAARRPPCRRLANSGPLT
jgi:hypothetical protein